jgi:hypothetical protein
MDHDILPYVFTKKNICHLMDILPRAGHSVKGKEKVDTYANKYFQTRHLLRTAL